MYVEKKKNKQTNKKQKQANTEIDIFSSGD